jgi:hypothetical protein
MDVKFEIYRSLSQLQEKFVFYVIALNVSAIGFSVYLTLGKPLVLTQIPLGLSMLFWGLSIWFGMNYLKKLVDSKSVNFEMLKLEGTRTLINQNEYTTKSNELIEEDQKIFLKIVKYLKYHEMLFYAGIVCFIFWHFLEMAVLTLF